MKKLLLTAILFTVVFANAQKENEKFIIKKGTWNIGGHISLAISDSNTEQNTTSEIVKNDNQSFNYNLFPQIGYFIKDNLAIGLGLGFGHSHQENTHTSTSLTTYNTSHNSYSIFPYIKKYFPIGNKVSLSLHGETKYTYITNEYSSPTSESHANSYSINIRPGITLLISKNLALEANLGALSYQNNTYSYNNTENTQKNNSFLFNLNSSNLQFGLSYYL